MDEKVTAAAQRLGEVVASFKSRVPQIGIPNLPPIPVFTDPNLASQFYERLSEMIKEFDASLDNEHEVGVRLVSFGQTVVFHLTDMGFWDPSLITFSGKTDDGNPVELIQHIGQISILLMKLPRKDPSQPKRPIGFASEAEKDAEGEKQAGEDASDAG